MDYLFDIGKVLLDFDFEKSLRRFLPDDAGDMSAVFDELLERKDDFEAGRIAVEDYVPWAMEKMRFQGSVGEFHQAWQEIFLPIPATWDLARRLKREGHRLILFSNTNAIHIPYCMEAYTALFNLFDEAVFSFEVGAIKPEREIYQYAIDTYDLDPAKTVYIDDLPANIQTGRDFGFRVHEYVFENAENHSELERLIAAVQAGR